MRLIRCQKCCNKAKVHSIIWYSRLQNWSNCANKSDGKSTFSGPAHAAALDGTSYPVWQPRSTPIWLAQMNKISLSGSRQDPFKLSQPSPCAHKSTPGGHIYKKHERLCMCVVVDFAPICIWKGTFALAHTRPGALAYQHKLPWQGAASFACWGLQSSPQDWWDVSSQKLERRTRMWKNRKRRTPPLGIAASPGD